MSMKRLTRHTKFASCVHVLAVLLILIDSQRVYAMIRNSDHSAAPQGMWEAWGLDGDHRSKSIEAVLVSSNAPANVFAAGEAPKLSIQLRNKTDQPIHADGRVELIRFELSTPTDNFFKYTMKRVGTPTSVDVRIDLPASGFQDVQVVAPLPESFGGYAVVVDAGAQGRQLAGGICRAMRATPKARRFPVLSLDERPAEFLGAIGIGSIRTEVRYVPTNDPEYAKYVSDLHKRFAELHAHHVTVVPMFLGGGPQVFGQMRSSLNDKDEGPMGYPGDGAWSPSADADFGKFVRAFVAAEGWPKGPVTAVTLWNEPWEGGSIAGWQADLPRYREIYRAMAAAVRDASEHDGVQVLVGGCDSSSNAIDKFFADPAGRAEFLPLFDFVSMHYQGLCCPSLFPDWNNRKPARVLRWDTESWVANTDERVSAVLASWRAAGYDKLMGVDAVNTVDVVEQTVSNPDGSTRTFKAIYPTSVAACVAAASRMIGDRPFHELLFKNGLPWVFIFNGLPADEKSAADPEDGTVVVVGDLHATDRSAAFPSVRPTPGATLSIPVDSAYHAFDVYGNAVAPTADGRLSVPLDARGFFFRGDGHAGSFAKLVEALKSARVSGIGPVEIVTNDFVTPVGPSSQLHVKLTNVLNRAVTGRVSADVDGLRVSTPADPITLAANETRELSFPVTGIANASNIYPTRITFDTGGGDGQSTHAEELHANIIARRTIQIDGELKDWEGVLPHSASPAGAVIPAEAKALYPFATFPPTVKSGLADAYLAYDDQCFYFAARIADDTPDAGTLRFADRDVDADFYPLLAYKVPKSGGPREALRWPDGERRFTYRRSPALPSGNFPPFDNVQIAFNVIDAGDPAKGVEAFPAGTFPGYVHSPDTDYEYALNVVAPEHGGGTEVWRLLAPAMPRKQFYPRQPADPTEGAVTAARLVVKRTGGTRLVECAIPWSELPLVKVRLDAGKPIKFAYRINDNGGPGYESTTGRSVSRPNSYTFHCDWVGHSSNSVEFGAQR